MPALLPYQQRVIEEKVELDERISKLTEFLGSDRVHDVSLQEQHLLKDQLHDMCEYSRTLGRRINLY